MAATDFHVDRPGWDKPLDTYLGTKIKWSIERYPDSFPSAVIEEDWKSNTLTVRERGMLWFMNEITDKPDWHRKVFDDAIVAKWKAELDGFCALGDGAPEFLKNGFTPAMYTWCIAELRDKAKVYEETGGIISVLDGAAAVFKSDSAVADDLRDALRTAVVPLEDVPEDEKDWHPGSDQRVLDLVHPSLWPLVYGKTRILTDRLIGLDDALTAYASGVIIPDPTQARTGDMPKVDPYADKSENRLLSTKFQWMPAEVEYDDAGHAHFASYINNLHPVHHKELYGVLERLVDASMPLVSAAYNRAKTWAENSGEDKSWEVNTRRTRVPCMDPRRVCHVPQVCRKNGRGDGVFCDSYSMPKRWREGDPVDMISTEEARKLRAEAVAANAAKQEAKKKQAEAKQAEAKKAEAKKASTEAQSPSTGAAAGEAAAKPVADDDDDDEVNSEHTIDSEDNVEDLEIDINTDEDSEVDGSDDEDGDDGNDAAAGGDGDDANDDDEGSSEEDDDDDDDDDVWETREIWFDKTHPPTQPEPRDDYAFLGPTASDIPTSGPWFGGKHSRLQWIVKLANIELTPDKPSYDGGSWHIEGQLNERIAATVLYYYDNENVTDSRLAFRTAADGEAMSMNFSYEQGDHKPFENIYGVKDAGMGWSEDESNVGTVQELGSVLTREGRLLAFTNVLQHRVAPFRLADPTRPGHRKIVALFLVDPVTPVISTANVPPQQRHWGGIKELDSRLPPELGAMVYDSIGCPFGLAEAKQFREELIEERKALDKSADKVVRSQDFSFCEH